MALRAVGAAYFYLIRTGPDADRGLQSALQDRYKSLAGTGMRGFECTIGVDDLDAVLAAIPRASGFVVSAPVTIEGVGGPPSSKTPKVITLAPCSMIPATDFE